MAERLQDIEPKESQPEQRLSLANTPIAARIKENESATDWVFCGGGCNAEFRRSLLERGLCPGCLKEQTERDRKFGDPAGRLRAALGGTPKLIEMAGEKFIETVGNKRAYDAAREFDCNLHNLYLYSVPSYDADGVVQTTGTGTGKTMLAAKVVKRAIEAGLSCIFTVPRKWLRGLYDLNGAQHQNAIDRLVRADVLVLDDAGMEPVTQSGFSIAELYEVVNSRWLEGRNGLVVTSNLSLDRLSEYWRDDRITSRLGGMCRVIEVSGRDFRQPAS